jgi:phosphoglucomutase
LATTGSSTLVIRLQVGVLGDETDTHFSPANQRFLVIAANADNIPYFKKSGLKGVARSMPTSAALDR